MKRLICGLSAVFCACALWAETWQDSSGNTWTYTLSNGQATITWVTLSASFDGKLIIPAKIDGQYPVLTISWPSPPKEFESKLTAVEYAQEGSAVEEIGLSTFDGCDSLKTVQFPAGLKKIGERAFCDTWSLETVQFPTGLKEIGSDAFRDSSLVSVQFPPELEVIEASAFRDCEDLETVQFPFELKSIGYSAFRGCCSLKTVLLPLVKEWCQMCVFQGCTSLETVSFPEVFELIPNSMFKGCTSLKSVTWPRRIEEIGPYAFSGCGELELGTPGAPNESFVFPSTLISIKTEAFKGCKKLTSLVIPDGVQMGRSVFAGCTGLTSVRLPEGLHTIEASMFSGCTSLKSLVIPVSVSNFNGGVFENNASSYNGCGSLNEIRICADSVDPASFDAEHPSPFEGINGPGTIHLTTRGGKAGEDVFSKLDLELRKVFYGGNALKNFRWIVQNKNLLVDTTRQHDAAAPALTYRKLTVRFPDGSEKEPDKSVRTGRFVRFRLWGRPDRNPDHSRSDGVALAEIELLQNGVRDPALTGAVVSALQSDGSEEYKPEHLIDSNMSTKWYYPTEQARFRGCELVLDAGAGKSFAFDSYRLRLADRNGRNPTAWCLSVSDSSTGPWTMVDSRAFSDTEAVGWGTDTWKEFDVLDVGSQKDYVREIKESLGSTTQDTTVQVETPSGLTEERLLNLNSALDLFDGLVSFSGETGVPILKAVPYALGISKTDWLGDMVLLTVKLLAPFHEARYVKIRPSGRPGGAPGVDSADGLALADIEFRLNGNRDPAMADATVTATVPPFTQEEGVENTHDNNLGTKWYWKTDRTEFDDCELVFDAGEGKKFCFDSYRFGLADRNGRHPTSWTVSVSDSADGPWTEVDSRSYPDATVANWGVSAWKEFTFGNSVGLSDGTRLELLADGVVLNVPQTPMDESGQVVFTVDSKLFMAPGGGKTTRFTVRAVRSLL